MFYPIYIAIADILKNKWTGGTLKYYYESESESELESESESGSNKNNISFKVQVLNWFHQTSEFMDCLKKLLSIR